MQKIILCFAFIFTLCLTACNLQSQGTAALAATNDGACPVTRPPNPRFIPPSPYPESPSTGLFWYGSEALWTAVAESGEWSELPHHAGGYTQKVFWWREGYFWQEEPEPQLTVTGRRLDASAPPLNASRATNAFAEDIQSAMLVAVDFPTEGCWEITGHYEDYELSFVVLVKP